MSDADYRSKALEHYEEKCTNCGATEDVIIHHRDGHRSNNAISNLIPLCRGCHQKVHAASPEMPELARELGKIPREGERTNIYMTRTLANQFLRRKRLGDDYEDVLWRVLAKAEKYEDEIGDEEAIEEVLEAFPREE